MEARNCNRDLRHAHHSRDEHGRAHDHGRLFPERIADVHLDGVGDGGGGSGNGRTRGDGRAMGHAEAGGVDINGFIAPARFVLVDMGAVGVEDRWFAVAVYQDRRGIL